jgi:3-deoxy-manno-octulosonate cytidylyltransferase (CMP-KDO synthetase)
MMRILGIIPARYGSSRFLGKALADVAGMTLVERVYRQAAQARCLASLIVATDDQRIFDHVSEFGGRVMMTSTEHPSGTDRCAEVLANVTDQFDAVINIQGDEPLIDPSSIDLLGNLLAAPDAEVATLVFKGATEHDYSDVNAIKCVASENGTALYFSRAPLPHFRDGVPDMGKVLLHVGIYGYRADVLPRLAAMPEGELEKAERLEQLRWLANGITIKVAQTTHRSRGIDTPQDLERLLAEGHFKG